MKKSSRGMPIPPLHQPDATLDQPNPVQNTWYTILDTTINVHVYGIMVRVLTSDETLEVRITIDGNVLTTPGGGFAATVALYYIVFIERHSGNVYCVVQSAGVAANHLLEFGGRSVKIEVRKTTAAGAGNLQGRVIYGRW